MKEMNRDHALQLFCQHAFGNDYPLPEYHDISEEIVATTGGLPLALQVIGSSLRHQNKETWKFRLDKLKEAPDKDVQETLMISYQALEHEQQQIFLDIACFFNDEKTRDTIYFWEACRFYLNSAIKVLVCRSLIKVNGDDKLWMHDQLRDLGRAIAQPKAQDDENQILAKSSRLWSPGVALDAVQIKEVAESVVALDLGRLDDGYCFGHEEFMKAVNLMFLQLQGGSFEGDFKNVFCKLRWLSWSDCPPKFKATNLSFTNLVVLKLSGSQIMEDWIGWGAIAVLIQQQHFFNLLLVLLSLGIYFSYLMVVRVLQMAKQLKVMHLRGCTCLTKTPNFSAFLGLKRLIFIDYWGLEIIDRSINKLGLLDYLEISNFYPLPTLRLHLPSIGGLKSLTMLELVNTGLRQLCPSIGELTLLVKLVICEPRVPDSLEPYVGHTRIDWLTRLRKLETLVLDLHYVIFPSTDLSSLHRLKRLAITCFYPQSLVHFPSSLQSLSLYDVRLPCNWQFLSSLINLSYFKLQRFWLKEITVDSLGPVHSLSFDDCRLVERPFNLARLKELRTLEVINCPRLVGRTGVTAVIRDDVLLLYKKVA